MQTVEINRLRTALRDGNMKPIVRMSRTMKLEINGSDITFVLPDPNVDSERLVATGDAMVTLVEWLRNQSHLRRQRRPFRRRRPGRSEVVTTELNEYQHRGKRAKKHGDVARSK